MKYKFKFSSIRTHIPFIFCIWNGIDATNSVNASQNRTLIIQRVYSLIFFNQFTMKRKMKLYGKNNIKFEGLGVHTGCLEKCKNGK